MSTGLTATTSVRDTARLISSRSAVMVSRLPDRSRSRTVGSDIRIATSSRPWLITQPISAQPVTASVHSSTWRLAPGVLPTRLRGISRKITDTAP